MGAIHDLIKDDVICALATPPGQGAIALVRVSGKGCLGMLDACFTSSRPGFKLAMQDGYTLLHGKVFFAGEMLDEVLVSVFRAPHSYTGEEAAEIGLHGSLFIQQKMLELLITLGCRLAEPGEFTLRAFLHGKLDLSQAEAVADLIASNTSASHRLALQQMRGVYSRVISGLRQQMVDFAALLELELDFSEEDVEFANRQQYLALLGKLIGELESLSQSFATGNVLKHGIPVAIAGKPNVGKSTLLNALLNEERAIVSEVPGTTRDTVEDVIILGGAAFRFIDTAGLRHATDHVENLGIGKTREKLAQASIILYVFDITALDLTAFKEDLGMIRQMPARQNAVIIPVANKTDMLGEVPPSFSELVELGTIFVSAKRKENINLILERLQSSMLTTSGHDQVILSNSRHYDALLQAVQALRAVEAGFRQDLPTDLITTDLREALHYLGQITGEIVPDDILGSVFSRFCIGK